MRKTILPVSVSCALLTACVHTTPNPVQVSQYGDDTMSCRTIENQMQDMQTQRMASDSAGDGQVAKNVGLGVAGAFLLVPLFFMDTSDAHSVEAKAAQARYKRLQALYEDRGCVPPGSTAAQQVPAVDPAPIQIGPTKPTPTTSDYRNPVTGNAN